MEWDDGMTWDGMTFIDKERYMFLLNGYRTMHREGKREMKREAEDKDNIAAAPRGAS